MTPQQINLGLKFFPLIWGWAFDNGHWITTFCSLIGTWCSKHPDSKLSIWLFGDNYFGNKNMTGIKDKETK